MGLFEALGLDPPRRLRTTDDLAGPGVDVTAAGGQRRHSVSGGPPAPRAGAPAPQRSVYDAERAAVDALVAALRRHAQKKKIKGALDALEARLRSADALADQAAWPDAMRTLKEVRAEAAAARQLAQDWAGFLARRGSAMALASSLAGLADATATKVQNRVDAADAKVAGTPPDFAAGLAELVKAHDAARPTVRGWLDDTQKLVAEIEALAAPAQAYVAADLAGGKALLAQAEAAFGAERWSEALIARLRAKRILAPSRGHAERRAGYEQQRATTVATIDAVKGVAAVAERGPALDALLARADALASRAQLKIEEGLRVLETAGARCRAYRAMAAIVAAYRDDRPKVEQQLAALDKHAAAAHLRAQRQAVRDLLTEAGRAAGEARLLDADPGPAWQAALTALQRAGTELAAAQQLADSMGPAAAAQSVAAAGAAADPKQLQQALAALQADLAKLAGAGDTEAARKALKQCRGAAEDCAKALAKDKVEAAARHLADAAAALAQAHTIQREHARYEAALVSLQQRLAVLRTRPTARKIKERIEAVADALAAAKKDDKRHEGSDAMADLRAATDAAAAAEQADIDRAEHEQRSAALAKRIADEVDDDKKLAKAIRKMLEAADEIADGFDFAAAKLALRKIGVTLDGHKLQGEMKKKPPDRDLLKRTADAMVRDGGAATVDTLIQGSPATSPDMILALASGRYGIEFKFKDRAPAAPGGPPVPPGREEVESMKAICGMFATIPDDVRDNPSIRALTHVDVVGKRGGDYASQTRHIGMKGRVGGKQKFGANLRSKDPETDEWVQQLPGKIDPDCQPVEPDKEVEYMAFAAAHEVGHGVDDLRGFMLKNGHQPQYGGWKQYGDSLQPIADAVGAEIASKFPGSGFYATPASRQYVLDKLMNKPAERPAAARGSEDDKALKKFDEWHALATSENIFRRQGDCDRIKIAGRIYHEAYARQWVSYLADARKKGLTGYQFRAPGEWFAELYAGWKSGKLGPKHPAVEWLKKL